MTAREEMAKIIADTNHNGQWKRSGRYEKERRLREADEVLSYLHSIRALAPDFVQREFLPRI